MGRASGTAGGADVIRSRAIAGKAMRCASCSPRPGRVDSRRRSPSTRTASMTRTTSILPPAHAITGGDHHGSRMGDPDRIPRRRRNSMFVARFFVALAANQFIEDTQCGFRLYPSRRSRPLRSGRAVRDGNGDPGQGGRFGGGFVPADQAIYPPQPTHFRSIRDVAGISCYVISYLMVKWGSRPCGPARSTRTGAGNRPDVFCVSARLDLLFECLALLACLPLSALYILWHVGGRCVSVPASAACVERPSRRRVVGIDSPAPRPPGRGGHRPGSGRLSLDLD